jgi:hypothetical protein
MNVKNWRLIASSVFATVALSGCFVESIDDQRDQWSGEGAPTAPTGSADQELGNCKKTIAKGCFDGHVVSKQEFRVDGQAFFDANELGAKFCELIVLDSDGEKVSACDAGTVELMTAVDNKNFSQGFEYLLTGNIARSGKVQNNGNFSLNDLPEGLYDLRVQKTLAFVLKQTRTVEVPGVDGAEPTTREENLAREICATLYLDTQLDVRRGNRAFETFSDYQLHYGEGACSTRSNGRVLSLNP